MLIKYITQTSSEQTRNLHINKNTGPFSKKLQKCKGEPSNTRPLAEMLILLMTVYMILHLLSGNSKLEIYVSFTIELEKNQVMERESDTVFLRKRREQLPEAKEGFLIPSVGREGGSIQCLESMHP